MIKNIKGVTLVELLIVIVVMGIIAAFAIPAVGTIIDNTNKDKVYADAMAVENAARLYCAASTCSASESLTIVQLADYVDSLTGYDVASAAVLTSGEWVVTLEAADTAANNNGAYEWIGLVPSAAANDRGSVTADAT